MQKDFHVILLPVSFLFILQWRDSLGTLSKTSLGFCLLWIQHGVVDVPLAALCRSFAFNRQCISLKDEGFPGYAEDISIRVGEGLFYFMSRFVQNHLRSLMGFFHMFHQGLRKVSVLSLLKVCSSLIVLPNIYKPAYTVLVHGWYLKMIISLLQKYRQGSCRQTKARGDSTARWKDVPAGSFCRAAIWISTTQLTDTHGSDFWPRSWGWHPSCI